MKVVVCDKCDRRCTTDLYTVSLGKAAGAITTVDLCAVCAHPLQELLPLSVRHLLPSKDRAEMAAKGDPDKDPPS